MTRVADIIRTGPGAGPIDRAGQTARPAVRYAILIAVFFCALGVRWFYATDAVARLYGVEQERYRIAQFYHEAAASLASGDDRVVFPRGLAVEDTLLVGYPPGYFLFMAPIYAIASDGMAAVILGETLKPRKARLGMTIVMVAVGAVVFRGLIAVALRVGLDPVDLKLATAAFVLATLALPNVGLRWRRGGTRS